MKHTYQNIVLISIESYCIGAGKSYLLNNIQQQCPDIVFIKEPINVWESYVESTGENLLELFYKDKKRYSYIFQNCAILSRYKFLKETIDNSLKSDPTKRIFITERSIETDKNVFAKMLFHSKDLSKMEYELYLSWYDMINKNCPLLTAIINVKTNLDLSIERIKLRNRHGEDLIDKEYLKNLKKHQEDWFNEVKNKLPIIDVESDETNKVIEFIRRF